MEGNIKMKVQTNGIIAIQQGYPTVTIYPLNMRGFILVIHTKCRTTQLKQEKIRIHELSYQPEKLYTESILEVLRKINTIL